MQFQSRCFFTQLSYWRANWVRLPWLSMIRAGRLPCAAQMQATWRLLNLICVCAQCLQSCRCCVSQCAVELSVSLLSEQCWRSLLSCGRETAAPPLLSTYSLLHSLSLLCWGPVTLRYYYCYLLYQPSNIQIFIVCVLYKHWPLLNHSP